MSLFKSTHFIKNEVLSGVTVSFAMIPEVLAFGFLAGISPTIALHTTIIVAIIAAIFGGRPGIISGAAGAIAIVLVDLVKNYGLDYLFAAVVVAGADLRRHGPRAAVDRRAGERSGGRAREQQQPLHDPLCADDRPGPRTAGRARLLPAAQARACAGCAHS